MVSGKTKLIASYLTSVFSEDYQIDYSEHNVNLNDDGEQITLVIWDTDGACYYETLRPMSYLGTDVFLCCFSVVSRSSFDYCRTKLGPELKQHSPDVPAILIGLKKDLRTDPKTLAELEKKGEHPITPEEGEELCRELEYVKYME